MHNIIHLKKALLVILGLTTGFSVIFGINFYIDSYQANISANLSSEFQDFFIDVKFNEYKMDEYYLKTQNLFKVYQSFDYDAMYSSYLMKSWNLFITPPNLIYEDTTNSTNSTAWDVSQNFFQFWNLNLMSPDYFQSDNFNRCFILKEGTYPQNDKEILIDWTLGEKMGWKPGDIVNISLGYFPNVLILSNDVIISSSENDNASIATSLPNIKISGYFAALQSELVIMQAFDYHWNYNWSLQQEMANENITAVTIESRYLNTPIFGAFNSTTFIEANYLYDVAEIVNHIPQIELLF